MALSKPLMTPKPLTEQDIDDLEEIMDAIAMLERYGVSKDKLTDVNGAKLRLRRKLLEDTGRKLRKPGDGGIFIVDSPGVGESDEMDEHVSKYLSKAHAFIYVINSANAGGVNKDRVGRQI
uniref:Uncharacterized protein n=1 Tax=Branchiostoma floridae TaxID=7739 RepID=C3Z8J9_BRAFL|eukprot:XP_002595093.1 hypothetical protein BRAFLDRAFT_90203 [Branchiostoma floridae]